MFYQFILMLSSERQLRKKNTYTGYYGTTKLIDIADSFKVRGWNTESNFDAVLVLEKDGTVAIEKHIVM